MKQCALLVFFTIFLCCLSACKEKTDSATSSVVQKTQHKQSEQPPIVIGDTKLYLTKAYSQKEGPVNIYQAKKETKSTMELTLSTLSQSTGEPSYETLLQEMQEALNSFGVDNANIVEQKEEKKSSLIFSALSEFIYQYNKFIWIEPNTIKKISLITPVPLGTTLSEADNEMTAQLVELENLPVYKIRPGQTAPDESVSLSKLKEALPIAYQSKMKSTKNGNITSFDNVDENQSLALRIIATSTDEDITPWLKEHIEEFNSIYLYALAYRLAAIEKAPVQEAFFWSMLAKLRSGADRALCLDKYVGQYLTILSMDWTQPTVSLYKENATAQEFLTDRKQIRKVLRKVVKWDEDHPQKKSPAWICNSGHAVSTSETYPPEEWDKRRKEYKEEFLNYAKQGFY